MAPTEGTGPLLLSEPHGRGWHRARAASEPGREGFPGSAERAGRPLPLGANCAGKVGLPLGQLHPAAPSPEPGDPSAPRGRGMGSTGAAGTALAARALTDGGGRRPPCLGVERRGGPVPTAAARVQHVGVVGKARGTFPGRFGRQKARETASHGERRRHGPCRARAPRVPRT